MKRRKKSNERKSLRKIGEWEGWSPTPEMVARAAAAAPFWASWSPIQIESIEELAAAFRLRCCSSLVHAQDIARVGRHAGGVLSDHDEEIYRRFIAWLVEMRARPHLKRYLQTLQGIVLRDEPARDVGLFEQAIEWHLKVRRNDRQQSGSGGGDQVSS